MSCAIQGARGSAAVETPVPRIAIENAPFDALLCRLIVATRVPAAVGTKSVSAVQLAPAAMVPAHVVRTCGKSCAFAPVMAIEYTVSGAGPVFVNVTRRIAAVALIGSDP